MSLPRPLLIGFSRSEFFPNRPNGYRKVILLNRGYAQPLHGIPALSNRVRRSIDSYFQCLAGISGTLRQLINRSLKERQERLETLQQRVVQIASNACALADARIERHLEFMMQLADPVLVGPP